METSGFDPELEGIHSAIIKNAGLIYEDRLSMIHYHDNMRDIPVSPKYPDIRFSHIFSENAFGKEAPRIIARAISALVECTKSSKNPQTLANIDKVFDSIANDRSNLDAIENLSDYIKELSREFKHVEVDLGIYKSNIPSSYALEINNNGHLIGTSPLIDRTIQTKPVYKFMKNGMTEQGLLELTILPEKSSFIVIAYKHELTDPEIAKALLKKIKIIEAPHKSIFKFPTRGHHRYEEMMAVSISPESINEIREQLGLRPFSGPLCIPFAYMPAYGVSAINSLEEYMSIPGLEKYRAIVSAQVEAHIKQKQLV